MTGIIGSIKNIPFRRFQLFQIFFRLVKFFLGVGDLLVRFRFALFIFFFSVGKLLPSVGQFLAGVQDLLPSLFFSVLEFLLFFSQLRPSVIQFRAGRFELLISIVQLPANIVKLLPALENLLFPRV